MQLCRELAQASNSRSYGATPVALAMKSHLSVARELALVLVPFLAIGINRALLIAAGRALANPAAVFAQDAVHLLEGVLLTGLHLQLRQPPSGCSVRSCPQERQNGKSILKRSSLVAVTARIAGGEIKRASSTKA